MILRKEITMAFKISMSNIAGKILAGVCDSRNSLENKVSSENFAFIFFRQKFRIFSHSVRIKECKISHLFLNRINSKNAKIFAYFFLPQNFASVLPHFAKFIFRKRLRKTKQNFSKFRNILRKFFVRWKP